MNTSYCQNGQNSESQVKKNFIWIQLKMIGEWVVIHKQRSRRSILAYYIFKRSIISLFYVFITKNSLQHKHTLITKVFQYEKYIFFTIRTEGMGWEDGSWVEKFFSVVPNNITCQFLEFENNAYSPTSTIGNPFFVWAIENTQCLQIKFQKCKIVMKTKKTKKNQVW